MEPHPHYTPVPPAPYTARAAPALHLIVATTGIAAVVLLAYNILAMVIDPESRWNLLPT